MKILLAATQFYPEFGGIESSLLYIAKTLKKLNRSSVVFTGRTRLSSPLLDEIDGVRVIRYPFRKFRNIFGILQPLFEKKAIDRNLAKLLKEEKFDAIWARHPFFICSAAKCDFKGKLIYIPAMVKGIFERNEIINFGNFSLKKFILSFVVRIKIFIVEYFEKIAIKKATKIVVFSNMVKRMFCDYYQISGDKFKVVPPGIDASKFKPSLPDNELLEKLGIKRKGKIFIYVGRVTRGKKVDLLLEAFSLMKNTQSILIIVGTSHELSGLKLLSVKLGISNRVCFVGYQKDISPYYNISDFLVIPSVLEGFGHVYLEAMACGIPCVAFKSDYPKVRVATEEIIIDGENGFLVSEITPRSLTEKMKVALDLSNDNYKKMSEFSRQYVLEKFPWEKFVDNILNI